MSQVIHLGTGTMRPTQQSKSTQNSTASHIPLVSTSTSRSPTVTTDTPTIADLISPNMPSVDTASSAPSTPRSSQSSLNDQYNTSPSSTSSPLRPQRSSLKPSLKSSESVTMISNRRSSPPAVRFAEPDPLPKPQTWPRARPKTIQLPEPLVNKIPNPLTKAQYHHIPSFTSPTATLMEQIDNFQAWGTPISPTPKRPVSLPVRSAGSLKVVRKRVSSLKARSTSCQEPDSRWEGIPLPAHFTPPNVGLKSRVASYQSTKSTKSIRSTRSTKSTNLRISTQSAPVVLEPLVSSPPGQYNPLDHYIPCLYPSCTLHYTPARTGSNYYLPQSPYNMSRLHGYCPRHANQDLNQANVSCKREYENLRQSAGRKTLGVIAAEFEILKEGFRRERRHKDAALVQEQKQRVLGVRPISLNQKSNGTKGKPGAQEDAWDWRYTLRPCTSSHCKAYYTPYSNHYTYYRTPISGFLPQETLCSACAKTELEGFVEKIKEKWGSRCGWDHKEWHDWYANACNDRTMEQEYWIKAQEKCVRERGPPKWVGRLRDSAVVEEDAIELKRERKSLMRKWFGSMSA
ncbi:hypothetical protein AA0119_g9872 [Alternaria tenuissima]|jgi:hypothetical protein|uniref:Uncharacterized protein n=4 Tax=Alternaria sect. Alternaria TaxID=2499237 RepID=A0A4Q4N638_ALTAL|nr:hypothetical protein AA0115_g5523 [Alternaria tenuissima]RYN70481.1 hypothetical protein AA0117_g10433 [Alternaria alternata]RYN57040.1 hypothetical protein AA0118_g7823 [Alternaria tenuissima]RYN77286.1 hypothetical protein AA0120_g11514 [Alternaria tenuissima]RYN93065.1 hypothetical protein AA0119_g9872 [Alternaria tenuissima]